MRSWIITAAVGLVALGLTILSPTRANAQQVVVSPGYAPPVVVAPAYPPIVVAPAYPPVIVAPAYPPVVVAPRFYVGPRFRPYYYGRPRGFVRIR